MQNDYKPLHRGDKVFIEILQFRRFKISQMRLKFSLTGEIMLYLEEKIFRTQDKEVTFCEKNNQEFTQFYEYKARFRLELAHDLLVKNHVGLYR